MLVLPSSSSSDPLSDSLSVSSSGSISMVGEVISLTVLVIPSLICPGAGTACSSVAATSRSAWPGLGSVCVATLRAAGWKWWMRSQRTEGRGGAGRWAGRERLPASAGRAGWAGHCRAGQPGRWWPPGGGRGSSRLSRTTGQARGGAGAAGFWRHWEPTINTTSVRKICN